MEKITGDKTVAEVLDVPGSEEILMRHSFPCITCPMAKFEIEKLTVGRVCEMYGINLEELLKELNKEGK